MTSDLAVQSLTTCEVAADGRRVRLHFIDTRARNGSLTLPTHAVHQLIMTLPQLLSKALKAEASDESIRAVFTLGGWRLEKSAESGWYILNLSTPDGFEVAFSVRVVDLAEIASVLRHFCAADERKYPALSS
jgi:hypothetical protein